MNFNKYSFNEEYINIPMHNIGQYNIIISLLVT